MGTGMKMKNILKGLRYISQIFDEEEEPEMQIGHPTDVKHVAHIGCDGQSINNSPTWMTEFRSPAVAAGAAAQNKAEPGSFRFRYPHPSDAPPPRSSPGLDGGSNRRSRRSQPAGGRADSVAVAEDEGAKQGRKKGSGEDAPAAPRNPQRRKPKGGASSSSSHASGASTRPKAARSGEQRPDAVKPAVAKGEAEPGEEN
ncbi:CRIB domain-containing protein RIC1-like [Zingiber officinale]|uniref:CRIB domain-containing protein RIC1-like n=1 Tax=Zingiber officinale TaxID=94328 RepID=UPI001C4D4A5D|nr:CRIB domain-containing protein RIC1-like [Zingiber officinale]